MVVLAARESVALVVLVESVAMRTTMEAFTWELAETVVMVETAGPGRGRVGRTPETAGRVSRQALAVSVVRRVGELTAPGVQGKLVALGTLRARPGAGGLRARTWMEPEVQTVRTGSSATLRLLDR